MNYYTVCHLVIVQGGGRVNGTGKGKNVVSTEVGRYSGNEPKQAAQKAARMLFSNHPRLRGEKKKPSILFTLRKMDGARKEPSYYKYRGEQTIIPKSKQKTVVLNDAEFTVTTETTVTANNY